MLFHLKRGVEHGRRIPGADPIVGAVRFGQGIGAIECRLMTTRAARGAVNRHAGVEVERAAELDEGRRHRPPGNRHARRQRGENAARVFEERVVFRRLRYRGETKAQANPKRDSPKADPHPHSSLPVRAHLPHHSPCRVKPIKRPKTTTRTQQAIDIPPASRARRGGVGSRFHFCTSRTVMNSKIIMLMPAAPMSAILIQNTGFTKYSVARLTNRSEPAITATTKAAQVNGRTCLESSANGRLREAKPSRRKSTIAIVPSTSETAKT